MNERLEKEKSEAEPIIKDEGNMQIVPVGQTEIAKAEEEDQVHSVD